MSGPADANHRWGELLAGWAIPEPVLAAATESPWFFDPSVFTASADEAIRRDHDTASDRVAREALGGDRRVLDVGVGGGAASLRLGASRITGVDPSEPLLAAFSERAERLGIPHVSISGTWPDVAAHVPPAEVVVCHHVIYNVADLAPFARALTEHATRRVVVELTAVHPMAWLAPYWEAMYGIGQPERPVAADAVAVLEELGLVVGREDWARPLQMIGESGGDGLRRIARRLCLTPDRLGELQAVLDAIPPPTERDVVTLWWSAG